MRLLVIPPAVQPQVYPAVATCPSAGCGGGHFQHWQVASKPLRDTVL